MVLKQGKVEGANGGTIYMGRRSMKRGMNNRDRDVSLSAAFGDSSRDIWVCYTDSDCVERMLLSLADSRSALKKPSMVASCMMLRDLT